MVKYLLCCRAAEEHRFYRSVIIVFVRAMEKLFVSAAINIYSYEAKSLSGRVGEELFPKQPMAHEVKPAWRVPG